MKSPLRGKTVVFSVLTATLVLTSIEIASLITWKVLIYKAEKFYKGINIAETAYFDPDMGHILQKGICQHYEYGQHDQQSYKPDTPQWELCTNALGWRGPDFAVEKPPGTFRIVCMGDSSTMGQGVHYDQTYCSLLGKNLESLLRAYGLRVETLNAGVWGHASYQGLIAYEKFIKAWQADLITVAYGTNDRRSLKTYRYQVKDRLLFSLPGGDKSINVAYYYDSTLSSVAMFKYTIRSWQEWYDSTFRARDVYEGDVPFSERRATPLEYGENVSSLIERARRNGALIAVLGIAFSEKEYRDAVRKAARDRGASFIPTWEAFAALEPKIRLGESYREDKEALEQWFTGSAYGHTGIYSRYLTIDGGHPTQIGHKVIAQQLYEAIKAEVVTYLRAPKYR